MRGGRAWCELGSEARLPAVGALDGVEGGEAPEGRVPVDDHAQRVDGSHLHVVLLRVEERAEGRRAVAVHYRRGGQEAEVRVRREIILAAGAIASPQILQVSGIGAPEHLHDIGVPPILALPGVGENLSDHYGVRVAARLEGVRTINEATHGLALALEAIKYGLFRKGVLAQSPGIAVALCKSNPAMDQPNLQVIFAPASYKETAVYELDDFPGMTAGVWPMRPESRGYVRARSADTGDRPAIQPNYLDAEADRRLLVDGMRLARRIMRAPELARWYVRETSPGDTAQTDDELLDFARRRGTTIFHLMGTCKMGPDSLAVVDSRLRVHGIEGLRVADASIMPVITSGNTNAPAIMIGEKAAAMILEDAS